ncbi:MAG: DNA polymerase III subunit alpha [Acholeplasmatales bacterium]|nr:DNA polymerase III subunit alpha [Acholeplasmatales bacterium]
MKGFLYGKTEYSMMESINKIDDYISYARKCNHDFLSMTDNNLHGAYKFYKKCIDNNIKPIIGLDLNYIYDNNLIKALIYPKSNESFKKLVSLSSNNQLGKELLIDVLEDFKDDSFVIIPYDLYLRELYINENYDEIDKLLSYIYKNNYYIGISLTNNPNDHKMKEFMDYCLNQSIKIINIHKSLYLYNDDKEVLDILYKIAENKINLNNDYSFLITPKTDSNLEYIISNINLKLFETKAFLPKFPNTKGLSSLEFLRSLCLKGLEKRGFIKNKLYVDRLNYELDIIHKMGYDDYFLIVWDFIRYSKQNDILVGPGRGSAAGSLVSYSLGIIDVNPIKYNLYFERFLNPERVSMPDIDTDFPDEKRGEVINYVKNLYGDDKICSIVAFDKFKIKSAINAVSKALGIDSTRVKRLSEAIDEYGLEHITDYYKDDMEISNLLRLSSKLENLPQHTSTHAAGIILSSETLDGFIPLMNGSIDIYQSQFEAKDLEELGLLKMDFLGIRYLTLLKEMMDRINFSMKDLRNIPLDDYNTYRVYQNGDTLGIFQFESKGMSVYLRKLKPEHFNDLIVLNALYRPGPKDNVDEFIKRRHGSKFDYLHNDLKPILEETYGIIVYQEQIMEIARKFASFSLGEADLLRRAISKKDSKKLDLLKNKFFDGGLKNNYDINTLNTIYDLIYRFADYGFNKSHSVAYSLLSYQLAWFKANHFDVYMMVLLDNISRNSIDREKYIRYSMTRGLVIRQPDINISKANFISFNKVIYMPLSSIQSINKNTVDRIIEERNKGLFKNFDEMKERLNFLTNEEYDALIYSGALDSFNKTKKSMLDSVNNEKQIFMQFIDSKEDDGELDFETLKENEYKYININLKYNLFTNINKLEKQYKTYNFNRMKLGFNCNVIVQFLNIKEIKTKNNDLMMVGSLKDKNNEMRFVIFPRTYSTINYKISYNKLYLVNGNLKEDNDDISFIINGIKEL